MPWEGTTTTRALYPQPQRSGGRYWVGRGGEAEYWQRKPAKCQSQRAFYDAEEQRRQQEKNVQIWANERVMNPQLCCLSLSLLEESLLHA